MISTQNLPRLPKDNFNLRGQTFFFPYRKRCDAKFLFLLLIQSFLSFFQRVTSLPASQQQLFKYVASLGFQDIPDYDKCRAFFKDEMKQSGGRIDLNLSGGAAAIKSPVKSAAKKSPVKSAPAAKLSPIKKAAAGLTSRDLNGARQASPSPLRAVRKRKPAPAAAYSVRHVASERDFVEKTCFCMRCAEMESLGF
jgi:hypothetical protein